MDGHFEAPLVLEREQIIVREVVKEMTGDVRLGERVVHQKREWLVADRRDFTWGEKEVTEKTTTPPIKRVFLLVSTDSSAETCTVEARFSGFDI